MADDRNAPATKGDVQDAVQQLRSEMRLQYDDLKEAIRDSETRLLNAFYGFAQSVQERFKAADDAEASLKKRMTIIEERLTEVEKRLNYPPQQTQ